MYRLTKLVGACHVGMLSCFMSDFESNINFVSKVHKVSLKLSFTVPYNFGRTDTSM